MLNHRNDVYGQRATLRRTVRRCLTILLFLLIYDGAIRKWLVPDFEQLVFIAKDVLLAGLLVFVLLARSTKVPAVIPWFVRIPLGFYVCWVVIEAANPNLPNLLVGVWGSKSHLLYASFLLLLPCAFMRLDDVFRSLARCYPWVVVPACGLALVQLTLPATSFWNQQVRGGMAGIAYFGEFSLVRVAGPFSYISGMGSFVQVSVLLGIALFIWGARSRPFLVGLGFALAALPATGSRAVVLVVVAGGVMMLFSGMQGRVTTTRMTVRAVCLLAVLVVFSLSVQDVAWQALIDRTVAARGDQDRALTAFTNAFAHMNQAGLVGFGTGAANLGAVALASDVSPFSWLPLGATFEEESGRMVLELGVIGWSLSLLMRGSMLLWALDLLGRGANRTIRAAAVLVLPVTALAVYQGNGVFATPLAAAYFWFCIAMLAMAQHEQNVLSIRRGSEKSGCDPRLKTALRVRYS